MPKAPRAETQWGFVFQRLGARQCPPATDADLADRAVWRRVRPATSSDRGGWTHPTPWDDPTSWSVLDKSGM